MVLIYRPSSSSYHHSSLFPHYSSLPPNPPNSLTLPTRLTSHNPLNYPPKKLPPPPPSSFYSTQQPPPPPTAPTWLREMLALLLSIMPADAARAVPLVAPAPLGERLLLDGLPAGVMLGVAMLMLSSPSDALLASFVIVSSELPPPPTLLFLRIMSFPLPLGDSGSTKMIDDRRRVRMNCANPNPTGSHTLNFYLPHLPLLFLLR